MQSRLPHIQVVCLCLPRGLLSRLPCRKEQQYGGDFFLEYWADVALGPVYFFMGKMGESKDLWLFFLLTSWAFSIKPIFLTLTLWYCKIYPEFWWPPQRTHLVQHIYGWWSKLCPARLILGSSYLSLYNPMIIQTLAVFTFCLGENVFLFKSINSRNFFSAIYLPYSHLSLLSWDSVMYCLIILLLIS